MACNRITKDEFDTWAANRFELYASESISAGNYSKRLKFETSIDGKKFRVSLGAKIIYEGCDFDEAAHAYHIAGCED